MKALNRGQVCAIIFICFIGNKLLMLPAILYGEIRNDGIILAIIEFVISLLSIWLFLECASRHPDKTMAEYIKQTIGTVGYKIVCLIFFSMFAFKTLKLLLETQQFVGSTIFKEFNKIIYLIPLILVCGSLAIKGLRGVGRICEAMHKPIYFGITAIFLLTIFNISYEGALPLFINPISKILTSSVRVSPWFGSYLVLFWCLGHIKVDKPMKKNVYLAAVVSLVIVLIFFISFYSIFTYSSAYHRFAISEITELTVLNNTLVQLDWFAVVFWLTILVLQLTLEFYVLQESFGELFNIRRNNLYGTIFYGVIIVVTFLMPISYEAYIDFALNYLGVPFVIMNIGVPLLFVCCLIKANIKEKRMAVKNKNGILKKVDRLIVINMEGRESNETVN